MHDVYMSVLFGLKAFFLFRVFFFIYFLVKNRLMNRNPLNELIINLILFVTGKNNLLKIDDPFKNPIGYFATQAFQVS